MAARLAALLSASAATSAAQRSARGVLLMSQSDEDEEGGASPIYEYAATMDTDAPQWNSSAGMDATAARDAEDPAAPMVSTPAAAALSHLGTHAEIAVPMVLDEESVSIKAESSPSAAAAALPTPPTSGRKRRPDEATEQRVDENSSRLQPPAEKRSRITVEAVVGTAGSVSAAVAPASSSPPSSPDPVIALRPNVRVVTFSVFDSAAPAAPLASISDSDHSGDDEEPPPAANPPPVAVSASAVLLPPSAHPVAAASALAPIPDSSSESDEEVEAVAVVRPPVVQQRRVTIATPPAARSPSDPIAVDERTVYAPTFLRNHAPVALPLAPLDELDDDGLAAAPVPVPVPAPRVRRPPQPRLRRQHLDLLCRVDPALAIALAGSAAATECSAAGSSSQAAPASAANLPRPRPLPAHLSWVASAGDRRRFRFRFHRTADHARAALPMPLEILSWERGQRLVPLVPLPGGAFDPAAGGDALRLFGRTFLNPMGMRSALDWMEHGFGRVSNLLRDARSRQQQSALNKKTHTRGSSATRLGPCMHRKQENAMAALTFLLCLWLCVCALS